MRDGQAFILCVTAVVFAMTPVVAVADYYDDFSDGWFRRDPNDSHYDDANYHGHEYTLWRYDPNDANAYAHEYWTDPNNCVFWDADNPDWVIFAAATNEQAHIITDSVADEALRLMGHEFVFPAGFGSMAAGVVSNWTGSHDEDPTWFDDSENHYILAWIYYTGYYHPLHEDPNRRFSFNDPNYDPNYDDPNDDRGRAYVLMHFDPDHPLGPGGMLFGCDFDYNKEDPGTQNLQVQVFVFDMDPDKAGASFRRIWIDSSDPDWALYPNQPYGCPELQPNNESLNPYNGPNFGGENLNNWERSGFWMLHQLEIDPNYEPGDPNGKWVRAAIWHGGKYDWDGKYILEGQYSDPAGGHWDSMGGGDYWYRHEGYCYLLTNSADDWAGGFPCEAAFDNVEVRRGMFSKDPRTLTLTYYHGENGTVLLDPEISCVADDDPNVPVLVRPYTEGTPIALLAEPLPGKIFLKWKYSDPCTPGSEVEDTNAVLYLVMDRDWDVEAQFKCGSSLPPFVAMTLVALGLGAAIRRLT